MITHFDSCYICHDFDISNKKKSNNNGNSSNSVFQIDGECTVFRLSTPNDRKERNDESSSRYNSNDDVRDFVLIPLSIADINNYNENTIDENRKKEKIMSLLLVLILKLLDCTDRTENKCYYHDGENMESSTNYNDHNCTVQGTNIIDSNNTNDNTSVLISLLLKRTSSNKGERNDEHIIDSVLRLEELNDKNSISHNDDKANVDISNDNNVSGTISINTSTSSRNHNKENNDKNSIDINAPVERLTHCVSDNANESVLNL